MSWIEQKARKLVSAFDEFHSAPDVLAFLVSISAMRFLTLGMRKAKLLQPSPSPDDIKSLQAEELHELHWQQGWVPQFLNFQVANFLTQRTRKQALASGFKVERFKIVACPR